MCVLQGMVIITGVWAISVVMCWVVTVIMTFARK